MTNTMKTRFYNADSAFSYIIINYETYINNSIYARMRYDKRTRHFVCYDNP